jgi:excisionase family DNA binding protein
MDAIRVFFRLFRLVSHGHLQSATGVPDDYLSPSKNRKFMTLTSLNDQSPPSFGHFMTLEAAASLLGVCKRSIEREIQRGAFPPPAKIGRARRVSMQDVETYAAKLRESAK